MAATEFLYDLSSPYAYLAAARIDGLLPAAQWRPVSVGVMFRALAKVPWSLQPGREEGMREVERRAADRGLPPVRWPHGWPDETYSLAPLRLALVADEQGRLRELTLAAFEIEFAEGRVLGEADALADAAGRAGLDLGDGGVEAAVQRPEIKERLRANTDDAVGRGVTGVPTIVVGERLFWGDDQLEAAVAAAGEGKRSPAPQAVR